MHPTVPPAKLLLVDDRPANLLALEAVLGDTEYSLIKAHSGPEALSLLKEHPDIALILLDVQMPQMDGLEVARYIKDNPDFQDIPIVFVTAIYNDDPFAELGYKAGAIDYIGKPINPEILKAKVRIYASFRQRANLLRDKERQFRESEALLRAGRKLATTLESLPIGVIVTDAEGRVREANDEVLVILKAIGQIPARSNDEFLFWWARDAHLLKNKGGPLMTALSAHTARYEVVSVKSAEGISKSVFISASPLHAPDRHMMGAALVLQNITSLQKIESDIEKRIVHLVSSGGQTE